MVKRTITYIFAIICVFLAAALIAPTFIDWNSYKTPLLQQIKKHTNFNVTIEGDIKLSLLPSPELSVSQVSVKNDFHPGASESLVRLKKLSFAVDFLPLLRKKISIKSIELIEPIISFDPQAGDSKKVTPKNKAINEEKKSETANASSSEALSVDIRKASIIDGSITLINSKTKKKTEVKAINLSGGFSFTHGFDMNVQANIEGMQINGELKGDGFVDSFPRTVNARLTFAQEKGIRGVAILSGMHKNGSVELKVSSDNLKLPFQIQLGSKLINLENGIQFSADVVKNENNVTLNAFTSKIDDINVTGNGVFDAAKSAGSLKVELVSTLLNATGTIGFDLSEAKPMLTVDLSSPRVDDKAWTAKTNPTVSTETKSYSEQVQKASPERWSKDIFDLSMLETVNADVSLAIGKLGFNEIDASKIKLRLLLTNGVANIKHLSANLFDGQVILTGTLNSKSGQLALDTKLSQMNVIKIPGAKGSVIKAGTLNLSAAVSTKATSVHSIINQLDGVANFDVKKGTVEGVDIKQFIADLKTTKDISGLPKLKGSFDRKADIIFNYVGGDIKLTKGVANTRNFEIDMNEGLIKSAGDVDLPNWKLALNSMLTVKEAKNIPTLGVNITGYIDQPQFSLDMNQLQKALVQIATNQLADRAKSEVKKRVVEQLGGKAKGQVADKVGNEAAKVIGKILPGLFG